MKVKIFLPQRLKKDTEIAHNTVRKLLLDQAGGLTRTSGLGYWKNGDKLEIEDVYIYEAYAKRFNRREIVKTLLVLRDRTNESAIAFVTDNEIHFI